jgi:hypothetical protein
MPQFFTKDPNARSPYFIDWTAFLLDGDQIESSTWTSDSEDITVDENDHTATMTTAWLMGGVNGQVYHLTNRIETQLGCIEDRTLTVEMKEK